MTLVLTLPLSCNYIPIDLGSGKKPSQGKPLSHARLGHYACRLVTRRPAAPPELL
jgi:hypothetical protein